MGKRQKGSRAGGRIGTAPEERPFGQGAHQAVQVRKDLKMNRDIWVALIVIILTMTWLALRVIAYVNATRSSQDRRDSTSGCPDDS